MDYNGIRERIREQFDKVFDIMDFDRDFLSSAIQALEKQKQSMESAGFTNPAHLPDKTIFLLKSIHDSGPTRDKYKPVRNQCLVLVVSYFSSAIADTFSLSVVSAFKDEKKFYSGIKGKDYKLSLEELVGYRKLTDSELAALIARKSDISFQDMRSIKRTFKDFFGIRIPYDIHVQNIIAAQAHRHVIVHHAEQIDQKCLDQIADTKDREVFLSSSLNKIVSTELGDLEIVVNSMNSYIKNLHTLLQ